MAGNEHIPACLYYKEGCHKYEKSIVYSRNGAGFSIIFLCGNSAYIYCNVVSDS